MNIDDALDAYIECALWASTYDDKDGETRPLDDDYGYESIAPETLEAMRADVQAFIDDMGEIAEAAGWHAGQFGHDFWLTRNHHGTGFWDRGNGRAGDVLTKAAQAYGESDLYVGGDGRLYII